jgi:hypothetical protein
MAKRFFYVCAGLLCLALTYHLGARSADATDSKRVAGFAVAQRLGDPEDRELYVLTDSGDVYFALFSTLHMSVASDRLGNFWTGGKPLEREPQGMKPGR